jgi:hypothetical protein
MDVWFVIIGGIECICCLDLLKNQFGQKSANTVFLVEKLSLKKTFVLKTIYMGEQGRPEREKAQKEVDSEIRLGVTIS